MVLFFRNKDRVSVPTCPECRTVIMLRDELHGLIRGLHSLPVTAGRANPHFVDLTRNNDDDYQGLRIGGDQDECREIQELVQASDQLTAEQARMDRNAQRTIGSNAQRTTGSNAPRAAGSNAAALGTDVENRDQYDEPLRQLLPQRALGEEIEATL